jgi:hypothetical protein
VLRSVLPSLGGNGSGPKEGGADEAFAHVHPAALADAVTDLVEAVAFEVPVIVFVDDWQWVDRESRALLGKVARRVRGLPCLFLFSERTQQRRQWVETAEALVRDLGGRLIPLGPLKEGELLDLVANLVELTDPGRAGDLSTRIRGVTGGNPLFVAEVMRKLAEEGASHVKRGRWVLDVDGVPESLDLPESVQELVRERLERLSATGTRIVATLAAERRSVPARLLRRRTGLDAAAFNRAVQGLVDQEVVAWTDGKHLDFTHDQLREAASRFFRIGRERWLVGWASERPGWVSLGVLGIVASLAFLISSGSRILPRVLSGEETPVATYPFGKGRIVVLGDPMLEVIPPAGEGGEWAVRESTLWMPALPPVQTDGPFRTPDDELRWFGDVWGSEEPPVAVELVPANPPIEYFVWPGDVGFQDLAPNGREGLLQVENLEADAYAQDLIRVLEDGDVVVVYEGQDVLRGADWSPDGQRIAASAAGPVDTVLVLSPTGEVVHRQAMTQYRDVVRPAWCGDSRHFVAQGSRGGPPFGLLLNDVGTVIREFGGPLLAVQNPICLGDNRAAAFIGSSETGTGLFVFDFQTGSLSLLRDLDRGSARRPVWLPDEAHPPIWAIEILQGDQALEWSESRVLGAMGRRSNGEREPIQVQWESSDPSVVAVNPDGIVTGNRAGIAEVYARYSQWLCDSVTVQVLEPISVPREVLFRETFQDPDLPMWVIPAETAPKPAVVQREGETALFLKGDGRYMDFIWSRRGFSLQHGTTLEAEFRLPITRKDRQRVGVCLEEVPRGEIREPYEPNGARVCFRYPVSENAKRRDDLGIVTVGQSLWGYEVDVSTHLPSEEWVHLAMSVRPDGRVTIFLGREVVFLSEQRLAIRPDRVWRIQLSGSSVDTELLVRNLTIWRGERPGFEPV